MSFLSNMWVAVPRKDWESMEILILVLFIKIKAIIIMIYDIMDARHGLDATFRLAQSVITIIIVQHPLNGMGSILGQSGL